jgi:hydrogenase expression/formation protein HypD
MPRKKKLNEALEAKKLIAAITSRARGLFIPVNIMEICGTHTMDISRYGLRKMLPPGINLISGPGCPVCVTPVEEIDKALEIAGLPHVIITTFGDMMRVPGTRETLTMIKAKGADIRIIYSPEDSLEIAQSSLKKSVVFIGIGFETTSPAVALTVKEAKAKEIRNFYVLPAFKTVIPPMEALLSDKDLRLDGFIAPGHVSAIIGAKPYEYITDKYKIPCVITGFEALDILSGILMIVNQHIKGEGKTEIQYKRIVRYDGNPVANAVIKEVFVPVDSNWRGIGNIPQSGLAFSREYESFDAVKKFRPKTPYSKEPAGCRCGEVLKGAIKPDMCPLFAKKCTPENPVGACMVSGEGSCAAWYKYER